MAKNWHLSSIKQLINELKTSTDKGLSTNESESRLRRLGPNRLATGKPISPWEIFAHQFQDFMVLVLLGTVIVSLLLGEFLDATAILAIVLLNSFLGFTQEYRAEKSLLVLKNLTASQCKVLRDGHKSVIAVDEVVPGDIIFLEPGDRVPADARLIETQNLSVDESNLTGESLAVTKDANWQADIHTALADLKHIVFKSTLITRGYATALVVTTGMDTEIGEIADLLREKPSTMTPLQRRLDQLGKILVVACLVIVGVVFGVGLMHGLPIYNMFMVGVTLAVAAIPEGLPAVVTIALSVGVQKMSKRKAIIRHLPAVETLGCATVICSDKTGTLTLNKMEVQEVWTASGLYKLQQGEALKINLDKEDDLFYSAITYALCTKAEVYEGEEAFGDPTEVALLRVSERSGLRQSNLRRHYPKVKSLPFDAERKRMTAVVRDGNEYLALVKGAPDVILQRCTQIMVGSKVYGLTEERRQLALSALESMADQALRVLATAFRPLGTKVPADSQLEQGLVFTGLAGMMDPPRAEVPAAIRRARLGGIRTIMVTGDHKKTATAIGEKIGIFTADNSEVMTGPEWEKLTVLEQRNRIKNIAVFARVAPTHKLSIIRALQQNGEIVAMTGDGVNDAPAVKEANIGVSMGIQGTDVTREASDIVLLDDNFETIISAVQEGRGIYENIRRFIRYLLGCNVGEVLTMLLATIMGLPLPLVPMQILWMNLVTDGLPAIALGLESAKEDLMLQQPRDSKEGVLAGGLFTSIVYSGVGISITTLLIFIFSLWYYPGEIQRARTLAFCTLVLAQLVFAFQCRSEHQSIFVVGGFGNLYLVLAVFLSLGAQIFVVHNSFMANIFQTTALSLDDWFLVILFAQLPLFTETVYSLIKKVIQKRLSLLKV